jgi:hypothetical protein
MTIGMRIKPISNAGYDFVTSMNVGLSMLVLLRKLSAVQGAVLLLLPTLVAMLSKVIEYLLPTGSPCGGDRLAVSLPLRSVGPGVTQMSRRRTASSGGLVFEPATRSSFRSRHTR